MIQIKNISPAMKKAAACLGEGRLIYVYRDGKSIRAETEHGDDPYVWRGNKWRRMTMK